MGYPVRLFWSLLVVGFVLATTAQAQPLITPGADRKLLDGVAAVAGSEVILVSDVTQRALLLAQQNRSVRPDDPAVLREILNELIDEKLLLTRAHEDSVTVSEEEITRGVEFKIQQLLQQAGSEERLTQMYKMSMDEVRREARDPIRQQLLIRKLTETHFSGLKVSDQDLDDFFRKYRDSLPQMPEQIELERILRISKPSESAVAATIALASSITDSIKKGGDFAGFARRYSTDPGSATDGGDVGFVGFGVFVPEYDSAMKALAVNEISGPVRSPFGIHVIQVLDKRPDAIHSRHILLKIEQGVADRDSLLALLKSIRSRALAGESFAELARQYSEDDDTKMLGGALGKLPLEQLPPDLKQAIGSMKDGEITEPLPVAVSQTESGYHVVRVVRHILPHPLDPVEDRAQLERLALRYKQTREYEKWAQELRKDIYWDIKIPELL